MKFVQIGLERQVYPLLCRVQPIFVFIETKIEINSHRLFF